MFGLLTLQIGNLIIYNPRREDSGNYSCSPSNLDSASVVLHVLSGQSRLTHFSIYTDIIKLRILFAWKYWFELKNYFIV